MNNSSGKSQPPQVTIRRLSFYLRCLNHLDSIGVKLCSSHEMAGLLHINPAQVRKDLAYFGEFGKRGVGYSVVKLRDHIIKILGLRQNRNIGIVGAGGHLGQALALYKGFEKRNFKVVALFDIDPDVVGKPLGDAGVVQPVSSLPRITVESKIEILILTVPAKAVQEVFETIQLSNVKAVLNFAPVKLASSGNICVHNVDLVVELESLSYHLNLCYEGECQPFFAYEVLTEL